MMVEIVSSSTLPQTMGPYSQATRAGIFVFCSGQGGVDPETGKLAAGIREQTRQTILNLRAVLQAAGSDLAHVAMVTVLLHDWKYFDEMNEVFAEYFGRKPPARSTIRGERWPQGALVAMSAIAVANTEQDRFEEFADAGTTAWSPRLPGQRK